MDVAIERAFAHFGAPVLGGPSTDGWSKMSDLQRCPYRYYLRSVLQAQPAVAKDDAGLQVGTLMHAVLATHYAQMLPEGYPGYHPKNPSGLDLLDAVQRERAELGYVEKVRGLWYGYLENWNDLDWRPVAVEMPGGIHGVHTCRFDAVAWIDSELWIVEHKTAFRRTRESTEGWWLDGEIVGEMYGWHLAELEKQFGARPVGVMVNLLYKTAPPEYERIKIVLPKIVLEQYARDRAFWGAFREQCRATGYWPRKLQGCIGRYDYCEFWEHCRDGDTSSLILPDNLKRG